MIDNMYPMVNDSESVKPITPDQVEGNPKGIHPGLIQVVNDMLQQYFRNGKAVVLQKDIVDVFMNRHPDFECQKLYDDGHMDFENLYRKAGWNVVYDKPGYKFTFTKKRRVPRR